VSRVHQPRPAARGNAAPVRPEPARPAAPLLELQRTIGNRAVQRAIGFELEIGRIETRKPRRKPYRLTHYTLAEAAAVDADGNWDRSRSERLPKKKKLVSGAHFSLEADEVGADRSSAEFVTGAFDETNAGRADLVTTLDDIVDLVAEIETGDENKAANRRQPRAADLGGTTVEDASTFVAVRDTPLIGKPQTTFGLRLDQIAAFLEDVFPQRGESEDQAARRDPGRQQLTGTSNEASSQFMRFEWKDVRDPWWRMIRIMGEATGRAAGALRQYRTDHEDAPEPTDEITSLLALVYTYVDMGRFGLPEGYAKTIAPVLSRTDFRKLFTLLSPEEQAYYREGKGQRWADLVAATPGYDVVALNASLFSGGIKESVEPTTWYTALERGDWLKTMATKKDLLTPANYPTWRGRRELEGLGAYGEKTDAVAGGAVAEAPILELRTVPQMSTARFRDWAPVVFDYVVALNAKRDRKFGE
jgi:hypothetical protein